MVSAMKTAQAIINIARLATTTEGAFVYLARELIRCGGVLIAATRHLHVRLIYNTSHQ
jgi:hypothetical protein